MIKVIHAGLYSSIQDAGRYEYRDFGVPVSGVMDGYSARLANTLVGNDTDMAVVEATLAGPTLEFGVAALIAISGADFSPVLNGKPVKMNHAISVKPGDMLSFGKPRYGMRTYIAVQGGIQSELVMGSRSQFASITKSSRLIKGDFLKINDTDLKLDPGFAGLKVNKHHFSVTELTVYEGPEYHFLDKAQKELLRATTFKISGVSNRMAYRFDQKVENTLPSIITAPVIPGTVQLTPAGDLLVLMRDCQTTGGYPRVMQLDESAIDILSQKFTNQQVKFVLQAVN